MEPADEQPKEELKVNKVHVSPGGRRPWLWMLLVVVLIAGAAYGAYWWRDKAAKKDNKQQTSEITELKQKVTKLEKDLAKQKTKPEDAETMAKAPTAEVLDNIKAAITSDNTAALEGYMASTVRVILAASEGIGDRTPTQAISDLSYLDDATDPWNFNLPAATIDGYQAGGYKQYFPETALVGKAANGYVVSFTFNSDAKISGIFMSVSDDLL